MYVYIYSYVYIYHIHMYILMDTICVVYVCVDVYLPTCMYIDKKVNM